MRMADGKIITLNKWDVLVVDGEGIYIKGDGDPWKIASHERLQRKNDELSRAYRRALR